MSGMLSDIIRRYRDIVQQLVDYEKLEIEVKQLTGYNFAVLKELFAMGYTLQPPEPTQTLAEAIDNLPSCFGKYYNGSLGFPCEDGAAGLCSYCRECQKADPLY